MKIALLGYGKMGKMIEEMASLRNTEVCERFWDVKPLKADTQSRELLKDVDVLVDFSVPDAVLDNVKTAISLGKNMVIGTTGWHQQALQISNLIKNSEIGCVHAPNFSIGINLFYKIAGFAAQIMSAFEEYDPHLSEAHHKFKIDAPSGTALMLKKIVAESYDPENIPVSSVRAGYIPGTHLLEFDSKVDYITLKHTARNREGLALGALTAAEWICGRKGLYSFEEVLNEILQKQATNGDKL